MSGLPRRKPRGIARGVAIAVVSLTWFAYLLTVPQNLASARHFDGEVLSTFWTCLFFVAVLTPIAGFPLFRALRNRRRFVAARAAVAAGDDAVPTGRRR